MAELVPLKAVYDGSSICGLSELRDGDVVGVEHGGLGVCTLASNTLLIGNGQGAISTTSAMTTNGQIIIAGSSGPQLTNLTGTSNEVEITDGDGAITIGLPATVQISTNLKTPAFSITNEYCLPTADGSAGQIMCTDGSGALSFIDFDGSGHCIAFSGTTVADRTCLNFLGGGVTVSDNSGTNATDITIPVTTPELKVRNTAGCELSIELENTAIGGELVCDTTPQLGGTLDVNGYGITSVSNGNISITPNGSGSLVLDGLSWPQADGTAGQIMCTNGSGALAFATATGGVTLAGSTNNTIATVTGSDALCGEANLTFDGTTLAASASSGIGTISLEQTGDNGTSPEIKFVKNRGSGNAATGLAGALSFQGLDAANNTDTYAQIRGGMDDVTSGGEDGNLQFWNVYGGTLTERMRIDSGGTVLIPTVNGSPSLDLGGAGTSNALIATPESMYFSIDSNNDQTDRAYYFGHNANTTSATTLMKIQEDGKVGIGTAAPDGTLHVHTASAGSVSAAAYADDLVVEGGDQVGMTFLATNNANTMIAFGDEDDNDNGYIQYANDNHRMEFGVGGAERMRITSGGLVHIGDSDAPGDYLDVSINSGGGRPARFTQKASNGNILALEYSAVSPDNNTQNFLVTSDSTAIRNYIYSDGDVWTADAGTLTSDERLKTNIVDASDKLADLMQLQVRNYEWTPEYHPTKVGEKKIGFIAQELETVFPALVSEHDIAPDNAIMEQLYDANDDIPAGKAIGDVKVAAKDHEPTMRKAYKDAFTPILVKALQEVTARLEAAEAKIAELESA